MLSTKFFFRRLRSHKDNRHMVIRWIFADYRKIHMRPDEE